MLQSQYERLWSGVLSRIQQRAGTGRNKILRVVILVDKDGKPRHIQVADHVLEPKSVSLDWLLSMLDGEGQV